MSCPNVSSVGAIHELPRKLVGAGLVPAQMDYFVGARHRRAQKILKPILGNCEGCPPPSTNGKMSFQALFRKIPRVAHSFFNT